MIVDIGIVAVKAFLVLFMVLNLAGILGWIERKGSALIQDRIGANRASVLGFAGMGLVNTLIADPLKFLTKEDFVPPQGDKFLHTLAPCMALFTALVTFAVIPFGDVLVLGERVINLQVANLNIGILYVFAIGSLGVYGIVIGAWASNNKFSLLGGVRGSAQMISYEVAMGLSVIGILMVFGTLELQEIARGQGTLIRDMLPESARFLKSTIGWLPAWGIFLQPLAFLLFFTAAVAETKRIPFDLPEGESELVAGYHVEYSGGKFLMFFAGEFAEIVTAAGLMTTLFFGGWQVPYLMRDGFHFPWGETVLLPHLAVDRAAGGGVYPQSYLFLLAANFAALECAEISLRSGDAAGLENAPPARFIERDRNRDRDYRPHNRPFTRLMDASVILFYVISVLLVLSSLMVVFLRNVVHCALALVAALFLIAVLFVMLHAPMVGVLQVLVYAGAIMVLFLFVIMFLNPTAPEPRRKLLVGIRFGGRASARGEFGRFTVQWRSARGSGCGNRNIRQS